MDGRHATVVAYPGPFVVRSADGKVEHLYRASANVSCNIGYVAFDAQCCTITVRVAVALLMPVFCDVTMTMTMPLSLPCRFASLRLRLRLYIIFMCWC